MALIKCKMCGGDLDITEGVTVAECEYCGTRQTVPSADNEKKLSLFARANRLRAACEFDKASGVYEALVADFPEEAEAYWGLVLCNYGIEYVDDPASGKKIPTCHRSSFESVHDDSNFEMVMEYADSTSRGVYREEAKQIEELRKGIIAVSSKEEPFDIFICYKETDENGERTIDSVLAQDVYDELTSRGYRVFFSRITLEDKLGVEYEPYIFAALNSAKIMLAFGTSYDYYNAVWVKNEWSRFLQLITKGEKKTLIPCYKNIDAYDIPKEFARLQAQDMGKVGAMQDLMRGIEKILPKQKKESKPAVEAPVQSAPQSATVESLLKRAFLYLEDGDWSNADAYCEKVLDIQPENPNAYLCKLLIEFKLKNKDGLSTLTTPFEDRPSYQKLIRFADARLAEEIKEYNAQIYVRNNFNYAKSIYDEGIGIKEQIISLSDKAIQTMDFDKTDEMSVRADRFYMTMEDAKKRLVEMGGDHVKRLDIDPHVEYVRELVNSTKYNLAKNWMSKSEGISTQTAKRLVETLGSLGEYKDSAKLLDEACMLEAETAYTYAIENKLSNPNSSARVFERLGDYKNSRENARLCDEINQLQNKSKELSGRLSHAEKAVKDQREKLGNKPRYAREALRALIMYLIIIAVLLISAVMTTKNPSSDLFSGIASVSAIVMVIFVVWKRGSVLDRSFINTVIFFILGGIVFVIFPFELLYEYFFWLGGTGKTKKAIRISKSDITQLNTNVENTKKQIEELAAQVKY